MEANLEERNPSASEQIASGHRFEFGKNWASYLDSLDDEKIAEAELCLTKMLDISNFRNMSFLDIGSGSGLMSLVAKRMGAKVRSFDYDLMSVKCTEFLKEKYFPDDPDWTISAGSALDGEFITSLGQFDIVYAWGVLHHTGNMWQALENVILPVRQGGKLFLMIYRDDGWKTCVWRFVKRTYCSGAIGKALIVGIFIPYYVIRGVIEDSLHRKDPMQRYRDYKKCRGMSKFTDWLDWLGGYPYEVATPEKLISFYECRGFRFLKQNEKNDQEYIFQRL